MSDQSSWFSTAARPAGDRHPEVKFPTPSVVVGKIIGEPRVVQSEEDDGRKVDKLVIDLEVMAGTTAVTGSQRVGFAAVSPGDKVAVWAKPGNQARALDEAIKKAGAKGLAEDGILALAYTHDGPQPDDRKKSPAKFWAAEYQAPKPTVSIGGSLLGGATDQNSSF